MKNSKQLIETIFKERVVLDLEDSLINNDSAYITENIILIPNIPGFILYNVKRNRYSDIYDKIVIVKSKKNESTKKIFKVTKTIKGSSGIKDTLTYKISPNTFEIISPIYSELQQRIIKIPNEFHNQIFNQGKFMINELTNLKKVKEQIVIETEIKKYLHLLELHKEQIIKTDIKSYQKTK
ncbi:MAG: hypothetical protein ACK5HP_03040 [Bacilli bacterium]